MASASLFNISSALSSSSSSSTTPLFRLDDRRGLLSFSTCRRKAGPAAAMKLISLKEKKVEAASLEPLPSLEPYNKHSKLCNFGLEKKTTLVPFFFEGHVIGYINPKFLQNLGKFSDVFSLVWDIEGDVRKKIHRKDFGIAFQPTLRTKEERTAAISHVVKTLHFNGHLPKPHGELYAVSTHFHGETIFSLDRSYAPYFGIQGYAVHVNGYVERKGEKKVWVGKRSMSKSTYPGFFDQLVAGGLPEGLTCKENVIKECREEAGIGRAIAERAMPVSILSYEQIEGCKFERYVLFCYDLHLPRNFTPQCTDGEVESFHLLSIPCIKNILETSTKFKPSCAIVTIDFLIRHGMIKPDQKGYLTLLKSLRGGNCL
ncbi:nudix hydrolase 24, chloroplastic-like [Nymphaea colorata]|nr:nudix hydrolase 24, chloroplastic-like [Nymphaea colorata]